LSDDTIERFTLGWDRGVAAYTIPIYNTQEELVNVRRYQLDPTDGRRKIWSVKGHGTPVLYPAQTIREWEGSVVICEGELDALITIQNGFDCITRTGAAKVWNSGWNHKFRGMRVYLCHDRDAAGQAANQIVAGELLGVAQEVRIVELPFPLEPKHGKDLTDYWLAGHDHEDFVALLRSSLPVSETQVAPTKEVDLSAISVQDSFSSQVVGDKLKMRVTVTGKKSPTYLIPQDVHYSCNMDAGMKCSMCPMASKWEGDHKYRIDAGDRIVLELLGVNDDKLFEVLRLAIGAVKCGRMDVTSTSWNSVEELFVRPSVERSRISTERGDYTARKIISVGKHDTEPSTTVEVLGTVYASPRSQVNEFQAWEVSQTETAIDNFQITPERVSLMEGFQAAGRPLRQMGVVAKDLAEHVTKIYGRTEMHVLMDLAWHSALAFEFGGKLEHRGWLDVLIVGDTRTGKSEAAQKMIQHYGAGEMISCESATFAGVVGGLEQFGGKEWAVKWGTIPINDRRLVVLDETSGLLPEQIAQMSSIRSSGEAQLTKIQSERTYARTRLIWVGNPRDGRMSDYTYGVQAIPPLIGNPEDIARFDLAMSLATHEVSAEQINRYHQERGRQRFSSEACATLLNWVWSRQPDQIVWRGAAQDLVYRAAIRMGQQYVENPPLVQAANVRVKIARVAVALAARTFSTDETHERILVEEKHVNDAVDFMNRLYGMEGFGYLDLSREYIEEELEAERHYKAAKRYVQGRVGLSKFLRTTGTFRITDMMDVLGVERDVAVSITGTLYKFRMIKRDGGVNRISPVLHRILRELR
jgi:hypothetical protein